MPKPLTVWTITNCGKFWKRWEYQTTWHASWEICTQVRKQHLEPDMEQQTSSKSGKEYIKTVYCHPAYLISMQSTSSPWTLLLSPVTSTTGWCFSFGSSLHSFGSYFSTDLQEHIRHLPTWGVPLSVCYHFAFSYCSWGSQGKNTEVVCHSLLQWTTFRQTFPPWPAHLGWPHRAWLSFIELDKAVVLMWLDWLVFCDHGFRVSALWCPLATPTVLLGFLLPWMCGISSRLLQQSTSAVPYLGQRVSPHCHPTWPQCGIAPLGPPVPAQPDLNWRK